ncbi:MAG: hypothetical protein II939_06655 [Bacteroidales bacterium]|nr:hypothetical protein [Bacteroidales bacterium]
MTAKELKKELALGFTDYEFFFKGKHGSICPFNEDGKFYANITYNEQNFVVYSIEELMKVPFLNGNTLAECAEEIELYG